jgi:hypothetical protein
MYADDRARTYVQYARTVLRLRRFVELSPVDRLYRTRNDAEAVHRQMEDSLWQKRANSYGRNRVYADLLGWALGENAVVAWMAKHRASKAPPGNTIAA